MRPRPVLYASKMLMTRAVQQNLINKIKNVRQIIEEMFDRLTEENTHPRLPMINPPVGKSGPGMCSSSSCS